MPAITGTGVFSLGRDYQIILIGPFGRVDLGNLISWDKQQVTTAIKVDRLDGVQMHAELPKGWTLTIEFDRGNPAVDSLFANIESAWFVNGTIIQSSLYEYITEPDGSQSAWQYDNVSLKLADGGKAETDRAVRMRITGDAQRRRRIS